MIEQSVFPLHSVVFPKMQLPLRIFEIRYVDMVADCLKTGQGFIISCIQEGDEVGKGAKVQAVGTRCRIVNCDQVPGKPLHLLVEGEGKVEIHNTWCEPSGLMKGLVTDIQDAADCEVEAEFAGLVSMVKQFAEAPDSPLQSLELNFQSGHGVSYLLAELLPITLVSKQSLLEIQSPLERLEAVSNILGRLEFTLTA